MKTENTANNHPKKTRFQKFLGVFLPCISLVIAFVVFALSFWMFSDSGKLTIGKLAIGVGLGLMLLGFVSQLANLSRSQTHSVDTTAVIYAVRSSSWIVAIGLVIIVLGFAFIMGESALSGLR